MERPSERYQLLGRLGATPGGTLHKAFDRHLGREVALRLLERRHGLANLHNKFVAIARIRAPYLVEILDYGLTGAGWEFVTMELVGEITGVIGPAIVGDGLAAHMLARWDAILEGVAALHRRDLAHGWLRPGAIAGDGAALRVTGAGIIRPPLPVVAQHGLMPYVAPEAWSAGPDPRADVYALGAMLCAEVTGAPPLRSADLRQLLAAQRRVTPSEPPPALPPALAPLLARWCAGVPSERPADADEARALLHDLAGLGSAEARRRRRSSDPVGRGGDGASATSADLLDRAQLPARSVPSAIGRERELADLDRLWSEARTGRGAATLLVGDVSMGATHLLAELELRAQTSGALVVPTRLADDHPWAGLAELVRALSHHASPDAVAGLAERTALAAVAARRPLPDAAARWSVADGLAQLVSALSGRAPLLLTFDDLDQASAPVVDVLGYLARAAPESSVLLVIAAHGDAARSQARIEPLARAIRAAQRGLVIEMPPLSRGAMHALVGHATDRGVATALADELHRASGGNPGQALALLRRMAATGQIARLAGQWVVDPSAAVPAPLSPLANLRGRLAPVSAPSRAIIRAVATLGPRFDRALAAAALGVEPGEPPPRLASVDQTRRIHVAGAAEPAGANGPDRAGDGDADAGVPQLLDDAVVAVSMSVAIDGGDPAGAAGAGRAPTVASIEAVDSALAAAVTAGVVAADPATARYHFVDPTSARALGEELDAGARRAVLVRARRALSRRFADGDREEAGRLAELADRLGDRADAARWLRAAAEHAATFGDLTTAVELAGVLAGRGAEADPHRLAVAEQAARWATSIGDLDAGLALARAAAGRGPSLEVALLHRARGEFDLALGEARRLIADGREPARAQLLLAELARDRGDLRAAHAAIGLARASAGAGADQVRALRVAADIEVRAGERARAQQLLDQALPLARAGGDALTLAEVHHDRGRLAITDGDFATARDQLELAVAAAEAAGELGQLTRSLINLGAGHYFLGDWSRARMAWDRARKLSERLGNDDELLRVLNNLGSLYRDLGLFAEARRLLERATEVAARTGATRLAAMVAANQGEIDARCGDFARASERYRTALAEFERLGADGDVIETRRRMCELDLALGRHDEALARAIDAIREARDASARLEEGILHRVAARAARLFGDLDSAAWFAGRARERLASHHARYELARAHEEAAAIADARGEPGGPALRDEAIATYEALGAQWDLARVRAPMAQRSAPGPAPAESDLVRQVSQAIAALDPERALAGALQACASAGGYERAVLLALADDGRPHELHRHLGGAGEDLSPDASLAISVLVRRVAATGVTLAGDTSAWPELHRLGVEHVLAAPLKVADHVLGVMYLDTSVARPAPPELPVDTVATLLALTIDRARLASESRRRGDLMSILAHEIRNPLSAILGYAELGTDEASDARVAVDALTRIRADGERLRRLLDGVMALARREPRAAAAEPVAIDLGQLARDVVASQWASAEQRATSLTVDADGTGLSARGHGDDLTQVLSNLIGNAIKHTPPGGAIRVRVRREAVVAGDPHLPPPTATDPRAWVPLAAGSPVGDFVRIDVTDNGPGIDPAVRDHLFDKFVQGARSGRSGLGLGLYIARQIVSRHGGAIWADAAPGGGASFSVRLPVAL